jgi:hypothetical protein
MVTSPQGAWSCLGSAAAIAVLFAIFSAPAGGRAARGIGFYDTKLPDSPRELAEYHFYVAQAYEQLGSVGKAHLHYEIVHDCHVDSSVYSDATRRMYLLRNSRSLAGPDRQESSGIPSAFNPHTGRSPKDFDTPSVNPWTTVPSDRAGPRPNDEIETGHFREAIAYGFKDVFVPQAISSPGNIDMERGVPEWSSPGIQYPCIRTSSDDTNAVPGIWNR